MVGALVIYGLASGFVGYVFLVPFALVGVTLWAFGKWSARVGAQKPPPEIMIKGVDSTNATDSGAEPGGAARGVRQRK
jgi:hypothetical protein